MNGRGAAGAVLLAATLALTGCTEGDATSPEVARAFSARWAALGEGERRDACWAVTAQALPDQQAVAMGRLAELFGGNWDQVTGLIDKECSEGK